jgi:RNA-binding protein Musashi
MIRNTFLEMKSGSPRHKSARRALSEGAKICGRSESWTTTYFQVTEEEVIENLNYVAAFRVGQQGCIVVFETEKDAKESQKHFKGHKYAVQGVKNVQRLLEMTKEEVKQLPGRDKEEVKIFVGKLNLTTNSKTLRNYFQKFGTVRDCAIIKKDNGSSSAGFGYCVFASPASFRACLQRNKHIIDDTVISVRPYKPRTLRN